MSSALDETIATLNAQIEAVEYDDKNFADLIGSNIHTLCANLSREAPEAA